MWPRSKRLDHTNTWPSWEIQSLNHTHLIDTQSQRTEWVHAQKSRNPCLEQSGQETLRSAYKTIYLSVGSYDYQKLQVAQMDAVKPHHVELSEQYHISRYREKHPYKNLIRPFDDVDANGISDIRQLICILGKSHGRTYRTYYIYTYKYIPVLSFGLFLIEIDR